MLRGRQAECAAIDALLEQIRRAVGGVLVLRGEPGIGKTALLEYALESEDVRVLRCAGYESESQVPFAGLHQALRPVLDQLPALAEPQRRALSGAFGLGEAALDRFMIGAAVLSLLAEAAEQSPLLVLVDDAHWLDRASLDAWMFAARRLEHEAVGVLIATRNEPGAPDAAGLPELELAGLPADEAALLLDDLGVAGVARSELVASTEGNPLALRELAAAGPMSYDGPVPLTDRLRQAFGRQLEALPSGTRRFLTLAAADDTGDLATIHRAAPAVGTSIADLSAAESAGLVRVTQGALIFRHPLLRSAAYHGGSLADRLESHRVLAAVTGDEDRRAWHLAAATIGPNDAIADALEQAGRRATARGAHGAASSAWARAAELSTDADESVRRLTDAAEAAVTAGRVEWANVTALQTLPTTGDELQRARLLEIAGRAEFVARDLHGAHAHLLSASDAMAARDPERAFWLGLTAVHTVWSMPTDPVLLVSTVDHLAALTPPGSALDAVAWLAKWAALAATGSDRSDHPDLDPLIARAAEVARERGPHALVEVMSFAVMVNRDQTAADIAAELIRDARQRGAVAVLPSALAQLSLCQVVLGRYRDALISGTEAVTLGRDTGQELWAAYASSALAYLAAIQGDEARCLELAGLGPGTPGDERATGTQARAALGLLELGLGRIAEAYEQLAGVQRGPVRHLSSVQRSVPDFVEAAVRMGRANEAAEAMRRCATWAVVMDEPWTDALVLRCQALLAADDSAEDLYVAALAAHPLDERPFDRARTTLLYGEWLRRARRKADARHQLLNAREVFEGIDARPWADRAAGELAAVDGSTRLRTTSADAGGLTPQELQIAELAASGMANRDIAAQLFLSPRTVAYHLYKAYPKLGIRSRAELTDVLVPR
ncbi:helix-turn-helix transcriptional regulator [Tenggerimyces flavus]|uniref:AAA family ATPase n=1 Tax=Tenggerimyces flavus TaxID=1708749 RepID=A0ABV7YIW9_9ACTN|nr:LuxR family transcriptional regulator [Tenggerimyces flavus]MBM7789886.1 DNA-binding CsgD family transcriptional regulator [Tenggerimyces flavus]